MKTKIKFEIELNAITALNISEPYGIIGLPKPVIEDILSSVQQGIMKALNKEEVKQNFDGTESTVYQHDNKK